MKGNTYSFHLPPHEGKQWKFCPGHYSKSQPEVSALYLSPQSDFLCSNVREPPCWQPPLLRPPLACICLSNKPLGTCSHCPWHSGYQCPVFELETKQQTNLNHTTLSHLPGAPSEAKRFPPTHHPDSENFS